MGPSGSNQVRDIDKFKNVHFKLGTTQAPIVLDNTLAYLEAHVINKIDVGTHTIFIGKITDAAVTKPRISHDL